MKLKVPSMSKNYSGSKQQIYRVENVTMKRTKNGVKEVFVTWRWYDKSFNSWIPADDLQ